MSVMRLRYYGNNPDPRNQDNERLIYRYFKEPPEDALVRHREWIRALLIGDPQGVEDGMSFMSLKNQGWVGLYTVDVDYYATKNPECIRQYSGWLECWDDFLGGWIGAQIDTSSGCKHEFVVRDIRDINRFLCRECSERFPRHPDLMIFGHGGSGILFDRGSARVDDPTGCRVPEEPVINTRHQLVS